MGLKFTTTYHCYLKKKKKSVKLKKVLKVSQILIQTHDKN